MSNRKFFTICNPLPHGTSREAALTFLHDHIKMIELNPLIVEYNQISPPDHAAPEEHEHTWYSITERISFFFQFITWKVSFTCSFYDLPTGVVTHSYASLGVDIKNTWSVGGSLSGEPQVDADIRPDLPSHGLYLREDVEMGCNSLMAGWVQQTMKRSHALLLKHFAERGGD